MSRPGPSIDPNIDLKPSLLTCREEEEYVLSIASQSAAIRFPVERNVLVLFSKCRVIREPGSKA